MGTNVIHLDVQATGISELEKIAAGFDETGKAAEKFVVSAKKVKKEGEDMRKEFPMWALSIMFFGMSIRRSAENLLRSAGQTFNQLTNEAKNLNTNINLLGGYFTFLKFQAGAALDDMLGKLIPLVAKIVDLVEKHPGLMKIGVGFLGVASGVGFLLSKLGETVLGVSGLIMMFEKLGKLGLGDMFRNIGSWIKSTADIMGGFLKNLDLLGKLKFFGITAGILLMLYLLGDFIVKIGGVGNAFKAVIRGMARAFALFMDNVFIPILDKVLELTVSLVSLIPFVGKAIAADLSIAREAITQITRAGGYGWAIDDYMGKEGSFLNIPGADVKRAREESQIAKVINIIMNNDISDVEGGKAAVQEMLTEVERVA